MRHFSVKKINYRINVSEIHKIGWRIINADNAIEAAILAHCNWGNYFSPVWVEYYGS